MRKRFSKLMTLLTAAILMVSVGMTVFAIEEEVPDGVQETETSMSESSNQSADKNDIIPQGVFVGNVEVSGMTTGEALSAIEGYVAEVSAKELTLTLGEEKVNIPISALGIEADSASVIDEAVGIGQKGNVVKRYKELSDVANSSKVLEVPFTCDETKVTSVVEEYTRDLNQEAVNATFSREDGEFKIVPEVVGRKILYAETAGNIKTALEEGFDPDNFTLELVVEEDVPDIGEISDVLGSYETVLGTGNNRIGNIQNGTDKINGTIVMPERPFPSMNMWSHFQPITDIIWLVPI